MKKYKIKHGSITLDFLTPQDQVTFWFDDGFIECEKNNVWYVDSLGKRELTINTIGLIDIYIRDGFLEEVPKPQVPLTCKGVKCMKVGCRNLASHKVGEENIWDKELQSEEHQAFENGHNLTTYLCDNCFNQIMTRETEYNTIKDDRYGELGELA